LKHLIGRTTFFLLLSTSGVQEKVEEKEETPLDKKEVWFVPIFTIIL